MSVNRNIFYTFFTQGPALLMAFFINFFITRIIRAEGRGIYAIFTADIDLLALFLGFTITSAIIFFIANQKIALEKLFGIGIITTVAGILSLMIIFMIFHAISIDHVIFPADHDRPFHYLYLSLAFAFVSINSIFNAIFQGKSLFRILNRVNLVNATINFIVFGIFFAVSLNNPGLLTVNHIFIISIAVYFINSCIWIFLYRKYVNLRPSFKFNYVADIKPLFVFISVGHLSHILAFLTYRVDLWIVEYYSGARELGLYAQAMGFGQMFWSITNPILIVLVPYLASQNTDESKSHFRFYSRLNFTAIFIGLAFVFTFADFIFPLYGKEFASSALPFRIISFGILMSCITKTFATYIYCQNKLHYNLYVTVIGFIITFGLDLLLIPSMGKTGASLAATTSFTVSAILTSVILKYKFDLGLSGLFLLTKKDLASIKEKVTNFLMSGDDAQAR